MQDRAMALMGTKLTAAQALEGKFSSEELVSLAGEDANVEIALARSLVDHLDEGDVRQLWTRVSGFGETVEITPETSVKLMDHGLAPSFRQTTLFDLRESAALL
jgi:hypothetical protein